MAAVRSREEKREDILAVLMRDYEELFDLFPALENLLPSPHAAHVSKRVWERRMFLLRNICRLLDSCSATGGRSALHEFVSEHFDQVLQRQRGLRATLPDPAEETSDEAWITRYISALRRLL